MLSEVESLIFPILQGRKVQFRQNRYLVEGLIVVSECEHRSYRLQSPGSYRVCSSAFVGHLISTSLYINEMMNHTIPVPLDFRSRLVLGI